MSRALRRRYGRASSCPEGSTVQSLMFDRDVFTIAQAKAWAHEHGWKTHDVDVPERGHYIHLRQESPALFQRVRVKPFGSRHGIQARVGWRVC